MDVQFVQEHFVDEAIAGLVAGDGFMQLLIEPVHHGFEPGTILPAVEPAARDLVDFIRIGRLQAQCGHALGELLVGERELHGEGAELLLLALFQVCVSVHFDLSFFILGVC